MTEGDFQVALRNAVEQIVTDGGARLQVNGQLQNNGGVITTGGNLGLFGYTDTWTDTSAHIDGWLERYRMFWEERLDRLEEYLNTLQAETGAQQHSGPP